MALPRRIPALPGQQTISGLKVDHWDYSDPHKPKPVFITDVLAVDPFPFVYGVDYATEDVTKWTMYTVKDPHANAGELDWQEEEDGEGDFTGYYEVEAPNYSLYERDYLKPWLKRNPGKEPSQAPLSHWDYQKAYMQRVGMRTSRHRIMLEEWPVIDERWAIRYAGGTEKKHVDRQWVIEANYRGHAQEYFGDSYGFHDWFDKTRAEVKENVKNMKMLEAFRKATGYE